MREFGWLVPIVVDEEDTVLAGHGRLRAAPLLNMETVPTIQVKHLTPERKRAFMLADNRLAELAEWDDDLLTIELKELSGLEFDFHFEVTGFETKDLDRLEGARRPNRPRSRSCPNWIATVRRSARLATCGSWAHTCCSAATPSRRRRTPG